MHLTTIQYNLDNDIRTTYDGANQESAPYFPAQTQPYLDVIKELYHSYGMTFESPVFDVDGTDDETERYGMVSTSGTKKEHVYFSTQHTCYVGLLIHAHARLYYHPLRGKHRTSMNAERMLTDIIDRCGDILPERPAS